MQLAPNQILCEKCNIVYTVKPGNSVQCQICGRTLTLPRSADARAPMARFVQPGSPGSAPMATPAAPPGPGGRAPQPKPPSGPMPPHLVNPTSPVPRQAPSPPSSPAGQVENVPARTVHSRSNTRGLLWLIGTIVLLLLVVGGSVAVYFARPDLRPGAAKEQEAAPEEVVVELPPPERGPVEWHEASRPNTALQLSGVKVRVTRIEFGEVLARDARHRVYSSEGKNFLQISLHIENHRREALQYRSWYGNTFSSNGSQVAARLTDDQGRKYQMMTFGDVTSVMGHVPDAVVKPRMQGPRDSSVEDLLVYDVPDGTDLSTVKYFRLELPGEAIDAPGAFNFQIPIARLKRTVRPTFE